jgi:Fe-S-cluster containining protein
MGFLRRARPRRNHEPVNMDLPLKLCPACGLCCNGVLFGDVELQRGDDAAALAAEGLALFAKGRKRAFAQPCACLTGGLCRIYQTRPRRCQTFACRQLQLVQAGRLTAEAAQANIRRARREVDEVLRLVRSLGNTNEQMPLNRRYADLMAQPLDFAGDESQLERRGELMVAVGRLVDLLERDFLSPEPTRSTDPSPA